ncbi:MAG TPA: dTDP-4-dehydrorhamnose 3,5-epimerase family protein [Candidatus Paceibacterota bacterium]
MEFIKSKLEGVVLVKPDIQEDHRGGYIETYNKKAYQENGIPPEFLQDDMSYSYKSVLRGIHADEQIGKLVSCPFGKFYLVIVNCDESSPDFGKWDSWTISDRNRWQVYAPPKHGVAHLMLSDFGIFHYKQSGYYNPSQQKSFKFDDSRFKIWWPVKNPILSRRDEEGKYV